MTRPTLPPAVLLVLVLATGCESTAVKDPSMEPESEPISTPATEPETGNEVARIYTELGIGYYQQGQLDIAWKRLNRAIEADPDYSTAHNAMGLLYQRLGDLQKAEEHFRRAVKLSPGDSAAQNNYGSLLCREKRYEEAEARFLQAVKNSLYESPELAYANAGLCMKEAGELDKAETYFRSALQRNPRIAPALINMSEIAFETGRALQARAYLQRYLEIAEHTPRSLWLGVRIERTLGDKNAVSSYTMLLKSAYPDSDETRMLIETQSQ